MKYRREKGGGGGRKGGGGPGRACRHQGFLPGSLSPLCGISGFHEFIPWSQCGSKPCSWLISKDATVARGPSRVCFWTPHVATWPTIFYFINATSRLHQYRNIGDN